MLFRTSSLPRVSIAVRPALLVLLGLAPVLCAQSESESAATTVELSRLRGGVYHLLGAKAEELPPRGAALLVVLPGGDGGWANSRDYLGFVENGIHASAVPDDTVTVLGVARRWSPRQQIVWPLRKSDAEGLQWTALEYVDAVVADVRKRTEIDRSRVRVLAWSSSGPLAHAALLRRRTPFTDAYIAMSVYREDPRALRFARDVRLVLDQSPEDAVTPFRFARQAHETLSDAGAEVWLRTYRGGHGWHDAPLPRIASGLRWLDGEEPAPAPQLEIAAAAPATGENLLRNGGFEDGATGWVVLDNSGRMRMDFDAGDAHEGEQLLRLRKTGGMPLDLLRQDVDLRGATSVKVSCHASAKDAGNAFLKFFAYDENDAVLHPDVDILQLRGTQQRRLVAKSWQLDGKAVRGTFMIVMVTGGEIAVDDVRVTVARE